MSCPICLNDLSFNSLVLTVCGHVFCWDCLYKWVIRSEEEQEGDYDDLDHIDRSGDPHYVEVQLVAERRFKCPICKLGLVGIGNMGLMPMYGADKNPLQGPERTLSGSSSTQALSSLLQGGGASSTDSTESTDSSSSSSKGPLSAPPYRYLIAYYQRYIQVHFFGIESLDDSEVGFGRSKLYPSPSSGAPSYPSRPTASSSGASVSSVSSTHSSSSTSSSSTRSTSSSPPPSSSSPPPVPPRPSSLPSSSSPSFRRSTRPRYSDYINSYDRARSTVFGLPDEHEDDGGSGSSGLGSFDETQHYVSRVLLFGGSLVVLLLVLEFV